MKKSLIVLAVATVALGACKKNSGNTTAPTATAQSSLDDPKTVVATINGQNVTLAEVDESVKAQLGELDEQRYQTRKGGLDQLVADRLLEAEAKKQNLTKDALIKAEVDKVPPPPPEQVNQMYEMSKSQIPPGMSEEEAKRQIAAFMTQRPRQEAYRALIERLKTEAKVELKFPERELPTVDVAAVGPAKGPENAPITIVTFSDFECPFCSRVLTTVDQVMQKYPGQIRLVFRDYPLPMHPNAPKAAEAAECANEQGKFWEMHDKLFASQRALAVDQLKGYAKELGLDAAKFDACLDSGKFAENVKKDMEEGQKAGVQGTPAFFVNGKFLNGARPLEDFTKLIDKELAAKGVAPKAAAN